MNNYQETRQAAFQYDLGLLKLINFNETSAKIYSSLNTKGLSDREWAATPSNPNRLSIKELGVISTNHPKV